MGTDTNGVISMDINPQTDINISETKNQEKRLCYIYKHIRLDRNEVFYIGKGTNTDGRYTRSKEKTSRNSHWKRIVKKHGYEIEIVEENLTEKTANEKEIELILYYGRIDLGTGTLVNLTAGGDGSWGHIVSDESKKVMSNSQKKVRIEIYTYDGIFIKSFNSLVEAKKDDYLKGCSITDCFNGKLKSSKGFRFVKVTDTLYRGYQLTEQEKNEIILEKGRKITEAKDKKRLDIYDTDGNFSHSYPSLREAGRKENLKNNNINNCINGKQKYHNGFRFVKINENTINAYRLSIDEMNKLLAEETKYTIKVEIYNANSMLDRSFDSLIDVNKKSEFNNDGILKCISGKRKSHRGYTFKRISPTLIHGYPINK